MCRWTCLFIYILCSVDIRESNNISLSKTYLVKLSFGLRWRDKLARFTIANISGRVSNFVESLPER
jgi:hypothetical protein